jgi:pyruvate dehydrogenase E1 component beta subunit
MSRKLTYVAALNEALHQAMAEDPRVLVLGENIRGVKRPETSGLDGTYGAARVIDMPISEAAFTGFATGAALAGGRPVVEFQVASLIFPAFDQLANQAAKLPLMLGGQRHLPITYLVMATGAGAGRAGQHSDNPYPFLIHAGIKTVCPSTPRDAKGLMIAAIREDDPVALCAPGSLLRGEGEVPEEPYATPLGQGVVRRSGRDVTVVAVGQLVAEALAAAEVLGGRGASVEVWDPLSLLTLDRAGLIASVRKTGRLVIFDDSSRSCGFAAEVSATVAEACFAALKSPIKRITRADVTTPYSRPIEQAILPGRDRLEQTVLELLRG